MLQRFVTRSLSHCFMYHFTRPGLFVFAAVIVAAVSAFSTFVVPVYHCFSILLLMLFVSLLSRIFQRFRVRAQVGFTTRAIAGSPCSIDVDVTNAGKSTVFDLGADFFNLPASLEYLGGESVKEELLPGEKTRVNLKMLPLRRGIYNGLYVAVYSTFPFGILRRFLYWSRPGTLIVYPSYSPLRDLRLQASQRYQPGGLALTSRVGESMEYIGSREYKPGDSIRRVDFKSWARTTRPAVREYGEEYYCRIGLVLDTATVQERSAQRRERLEAAVSLCASLADFLDRGDHVIDLFAAGHELHVFRYGRSIAHLENVLELLAGVRENRKDQLESIIPEIIREMPGISDLICVFMKWDEPRRRIVSEALEQGCTVRVFVVTQGRETPGMGDEFERYVTHVSASEIRSGEIEQL